jgi:hypothetical protein
MWISVLCVFSLPEVTHAAGYWDGKNDFQVQAIVRVQAVSKPSDLEADILKFLSALACHVLTDSGWQLP